MKGSHMRLLCLHGSCLLVCHAISLHAQPDHYKDITRKIYSTFLDGILPGLSSDFDGFRLNVYSDDRQDYILEVLSTINLKKVNYYAWDSKVNRLILLEAKDKSLSCIFHDEAKYHLVGTNKGGRSIE